MHLYHLTLQKPTVATYSVVGNFSGTKVQELVIARGTVLELHRPDMNTGKVIPVVSTQVFGIIRSLSAFRLQGNKKDYVIVGSDSGKITILDYAIADNRFNIVHQEMMGKTGCRRIIPGQYLSVEAGGRAAMIAAPEKTKLVYVLNRDSQDRLTISSPLEGNKSNSILFHVVGLDNGHENPRFACLELDHTEADEDPTGESLEDVRQNLVCYELELGTNHVVRKHADPLDDIANYLIPVPGPLVGGPGGVIVCSENFLTYKNFGENAQKDIRVPIPRRNGDLSDPERGVIVVTHASIATKAIMLSLFQTELGDLFKLTIDVEGTTVSDISIKYFDTLPVGASLNIFRNGFLFCASEFSNQYLYQIQNLGDDDSEKIFNSRTPYSEDEWPTFDVHELRNLGIVDELEGLAPIMDCKIANLSNDTTPQFFTACGRGARSSFRVLRHGLEVAEMALSDLPGVASGVWTVRHKSTDAHDAYIVVSFVNATLVLAVGETVEEVTNSGLIATSPTLLAATTGDAGIIQVCPECVNFVRPNKPATQWPAPTGYTITHATVNERQLAVVLNNVEVVYFEIDNQGVLNDYADRLDLGSTISCVALGSVPENRQRCRFLAVGYEDNTVRLVSVDPEDMLQPLSMQALPQAAPSSLCLVTMEDGSDSGDKSTQYLNIGLANGVMLRTTVDPVTGMMSDTRTRYLGSKPVKMYSVKVQGKAAVMALSSRPWLSYPYQGRLMTTPLSYDTLSSAAGFAAEICPEGFVAIAESTLRIISTEKLGGAFNQMSTPLAFTPRKLVIHPESNMMLVIESEHNCLTDKQIMEKMGDSAMETDNPLTDFATFGRPRPGPGQWASLLRIVDPNTNETASVYEFENNESAVSIAACNFHGVDGTYIIVGTAENLELQPRKCTGGALYTFRTVSGGRDLELLHKTSVDDVPGSLCPFQGRILVSVGRLLRLYDLGKRKLLRKCENKQIPNYIVKILTVGSRIFAADVQESWHFIKFKAEQNQMVIFADDVVPRYVTTGCVLDYDTICGADKFGNVYVLRTAEGTIDDIDDDPTGAKAVWQRGLLGGAPQKVECVAQFFVGEAISSLQKSTLISGGGECILYTTLSGGIGILAPFSSKSDVDFFQHLEMHMQQSSPPLLGRDHLQYRGYYAPRKNILDGDLMEQFNTMDLKKRRDAAEELDRTPQEVSKKLEDIRSRFAF